MSAIEMTGQRRPAMFSWRRGISMARPFPDAKPLGG
jgi:hypothetical protein